MKTIGIEGGPDRHAGSTTATTDRGPPSGVRSARTSSDGIPIRRPHFRRRGSDLFFLISRRPTASLDATGIAVWDAIDGEATVGRLQARFPEAAARIEEFRRLGMVEIVETDFSPFRVPILVVEPHMDDAILSVGGQMWTHRHQCEFRVLTVVGISNFTTYERIGREFFDVETVSELRCAESRLVMRMLAGRHSAFDVSDAPLRYQPGTWTLDWFARHRRSLAAFKNGAPDRRETAELEERFCETFRTTDAKQIWIPMGIGTSADHEMTRNACLGALVRVRDLLRDVEVFMYEDVPYVNRFPAHARQLVDAMSTLGGELQPAYADIGESMPAKLRMLEVFGSQFKPGYMNPKVKAAARAAARPGMAFGERTYRFRRLPERMDDALLYSGRDAVRSLRARLDRWHPKHRDATRIRIILPLGAGRWAECMECLRAAFPKAIFEVHINEQALDETRRFRSPDIELRPIPGRPAAWVSALLRIAVARPIPTIVVTSNKLWRTWPLLACGFRPSDPLLVATMGHLMLALRARGA